MTPIAPDKPRTHRRARPWVAIVRPRSGKWFRSRPFHTEYEARLWAATKTKVGRVFIQLA